MVPLFLEFPALQFGQILNGIDIVKAVPVCVEPEFAGIKFLQLMAVILGQSGQITGDTPLPGILDDGIQRRLQIAGSDGEGVDTAPVELGKENQVIFCKGGFLTAPDEFVGKGIFAAPFPAVEQVSVIIFLVVKIHSFKGKHFSHILRRYFIIYDSIRQS